MDLNSVTTLMFKYIVPTHEAFIGSTVAIETIPNIIGDAIPENWTEDIFRIFNRRYKNWEIKFLQPDAFLDSLWEELEVQVPNYYERKKRYSDMLNMTDKELMSLGYSLSNFTEHNNTQVTDPLDTILPNVSTQSSNKQFADKALRLRTQIRNSQLRLLSDFLDTFKNLFITSGGCINYWNLH